MPPAIQTAFNVNHVGAVAGQVFGTHPILRESRLAAAAIPFGTFVCRRASPADGVDQCANPAASADVTARLLGIALYTDNARNTFGWEINAGVSYMRRGYCWVPCESACAEGAQPFIRFAAGTGIILGAVYNGADTTTAVQYGTPAIIFRNTLSAAGLALVEINLPG